MKAIKVLFDDGNNFITRINGTIEEIKEYYINNYFNLGIFDDDMHKVVAIEFL